MVSCFLTSMSLPQGYLSFVDKWPLMEPSDVATILVAYLTFVLKVGPAMMENRPPVKINRLLFLYNFGKVVNSTVLAYKFMYYILEKGLFPRKCEHDENTLHIIASLYWKYMVTKILDLCDTVFFIIRKKQSQVTFLHVYHHTFMVMITWSCLKYDPSDHWAFMAVMNCCIHTTMYTYYGIASLGPKYAKYVWWKKYLTMMQVIQFVLVIGHLVLQTYTSQCPMHFGSYCVGLSNLALFICLFMDFYIKQYSSKVTGEAKDVGFACTRQSID